MTETEAIRLFKCLSDKSRLQILKSLVIEDMYVERLAERLGISAPTVSFHLKKLTEAGAVTSYKSQYYMMYSLRKEIFETSILEILQEKSDESEVQAQRDAEYRQKVIDAFFEYGKLKSIPAQQKKERIILEVIAETFADKDCNAIPAVLVKNHGPFTWGVTPEKAVENAVTLEAVAKMAIETERINPQAKEVDKYLLDKHYFRKHGKNAYYGQK